MSVNVGMQRMTSPAQWLTGMRWWFKNAAFHRTQGAKLRTYLWGLQEVCRSMSRVAKERDAAGKLNE